MKNPDSQMSGSEQSAGQAALSRSLLEQDGLTSMILRDAPTQQVTTEAERMASLRETLATRPGEDVWIFAYGSLIWNPTIAVAERRRARITGWHRSFCLMTSVGRGSPDRPGLILGLDAGGVCEGIALRVAPDILEEELAVLWRREMVTAAYVPCWVELFDQQDERFGSAIAFTINRAGSQYAGDLAPDEMVERLATGCGSLGSSADYLFRTREALRMQDIADGPLEQLAADVEARILTYRVADESCGSPSILGDAPPRGIDIPPL
jgi:cation transport protein ChaC